MNLKNKKEAGDLKSNMHATFDSPQGQETMKFLEQIGGWYPTSFDSMDTNDIILREGSRRLLGTIKTILTLSPEQIVSLAKQWEE